MNVSKFFLPIFFLAILFIHPSCKKEDDLTQNQNNNSNNNNSNNNNSNNNNNNNTNNNNNNNNNVFPHGSVPWPEWIFYHWVWEDESTQQSAMQLADDYLSHDIPVGAIIIDSPWETGYNTFEWDSTRFPDAQAMINYFHSKNIRVFIWITSAINTDVQPLYDYAKNQNYFMKASAGSSSPAVIEWWKGDGSLIDLFNPDAVAWWKTLMDKTLALGIDGWKCDGTDYYVANPLSPTAYSPGKGSTVSREEYSHAYYRLFHEYSRQSLGNDRVITARPIDNYGIVDAGGDFFAFAPKDINFCAWVGDQDATFDGLKAALNNMYHSAEHGYLSFGSDIAGYREDNNFPNQRSKELFIRWAQLGAFSPIMENGGGGEHRPWMFDQQTNDIYRKLAKVHHCLVPYFMHKAEIAFNAGESMVQYLNKNDYSYLLCEDLFITPFLETGTEIQITFPAGSRWIYFYDETKIYDGGQTLQLTFSYDEFPVFIKEGTVLVDFIDYNSIQ